MNTSLLRAPLTVALVLLLAGCSILKNRDDFTLRDADAGPPDGNVELGDETGMEDDRVPPDGRPDGAVPCADPAECGYRDFSSGPRHTCAIRRENNVLECWGSNRFGESFGPDATSLEVPTPAVGPEGSAVEGEIRAHDVVAGDGMTCFLLDDGTEDAEQAGPAYCVGSNANRRSGQPAMVDTLGLPTRVCALDSPTDCAAGDERVPEFVQLATRNRRVCGVTAEDAVWCWGFGEEGQLRGSEGAAVPFAVDLPDGINAGGTQTPMLVMSDRVTCLRARSGQVACFGNNEFGDLGRETSGEQEFFRLDFVDDPNGGVLNNVLSLSARSGTFCAVRDGQLLCWGRNEDELIPGAESRQRSPFQVSADAEVAQVAFLEDALCYWDGGGVAYCRGSQSRNELGQGAMNRTLVEDESFTTLDALDELTSAGGSGSFCGLGAPDSERDGELICWGYAPFGQIPRSDLVIESPQTVERPVRPSGGSPGNVDIRAGSLSLGENGSCLISETAPQTSVYCAGITVPNGRAEAGFSVPYDGYEAVLGTNAAINVFQGPLGACALFGLSARDEALCWGRNVSGTLANHSLAAAAATGQEMLAGLSSISMGVDHGCGTTVGPENEIRCWGNNANAELGRPLSVAPLDVGSMQVSNVNVPARAPAAGRDFTCVILTDEFDAGTAGGIGDGEEVLCLGKNDVGQLGYSQDGETLSPLMVVPDVERARALAAGEDHACALLSNNQVWCWGSNERRQLGRENRSATTPAQVSLEFPIDNAASIAASNQSTCIGLAIGEVHCWGSNEHHQLGVDRAFLDGTETPEMALSVDPGTGFAVFSHTRANGYCAGPDERGDYHCWGNNNFRKLGVGESVFCAPGPVSEGCNVNRLSGL
ncbi:MAG: hypothetical protein AAF938_02905 [Myxococcota bacterium]